MMTTSYIRYYVTRVTQTIAESADEMQHEEICCLPEGDPRRWSDRGMAEQWIDTKVAGMEALRELYNIVEKVVRFERDDFTVIDNVHLLTYDFVRD